MTVNKLSWKLKMIPKVSYTNALIVTNLKFSKTHNGHIDICAQIGTRFVQTNKQTYTKNALKMLYTVAINWTMALSIGSWHLKSIPKVRSNVCTVD